MAEIVECESHSDIGSRCSGTVFLEDGSSHRCGKPIFLCHMDESGAYFYHEDNSFGMTVKGKFIGCDYVRKQHKPYVVMRPGVDYG